jgi:hypothetical protein
MRFIYWAAVVAMAIMPLNYVLMVAAKLVHNETFGREDAIGLGIAVFGLVAATMIYRFNLRKTPTGGAKARQKELN